nr:hypothetical protein [Tanacetum cinerariifolium]
LHQLHPGLCQDAPGIDRRGGLAARRVRHRVQLPGNPHQFVGHLRRRRTVAVPAADRAEKGRRRRLGPATVGRLPGPAGRRRVAAIDPGQAGKLPADRHQRRLPQLRSLADGQHPGAGRPDDRHLGRDHLAAHRPQGTDHRPPVDAGAGSDRSADVPRRRRKDRAGSVAQPRHHRPPAQRAAQVIRKQ